MSDVRFLPRRVALTGTVAQEIKAPRAARSVNAINTGVDVLRIYESQTAAAVDAQYVEVAVGWDRTLTLPDHQCYLPDETAFWVKTPQSGTVTFLWF